MMLYFVRRHWYKYNYPINFQIKIHTLTIPKTFYSINTHVSKPFCVFSGTLEHLFNHSLAVYMSLKSNFTKKKILSAPFPTAKISCPYSIYPHVCYNPWPLYIPLYVLILDCYINGIRKTLDSKKGKWYYSIIISSTIVGDRLLYCG